MLCAVVCAMSAACALRTDLTLHRRCPTPTTPTDAAGGAAKNGGGLLRPVGNLPLKIPSAMRKRAYDETTVGLLACLGSYIKQQFMLAMALGHAQARERLTTSILLAKRLAKCRLCTVMAAICIYGDVDC